MTRQREVSVTTLHGLGPALQERRQELGMTQAQLAAKAHVGRDWVGRLEAGAPRLELASVMRTVRALDLELVLRPVEVADTDPFAGL